MSGPPETKQEQAPTRRPRAFALDDPAIEVVREAPRGGDAAADGDELPRPLPPHEDGWGERLANLSLDRSFRWGSLLFSAALGLTSLAFALWFVRFTAIAFTRNDWVGWLAFGLLMLVALSVAVLIAREIRGIWRFRRLGRIKADAERALREGDKKAEALAVQRITAAYRGRPALKWSLARLDEHAKAVHDAGDLFRLTDRDLLLPLDGEARRLVASSARRVAVVSAVSPTGFLTVGWVLIENLRLLRALAGLYGGRPGFVGTMRLARMVFVNIVATGGIAMTDDLLGQFLGQDLIRRLSARLGESVFNAALTARIGAAAIGVIRPLPYIEAPPVRARDFMGEILRPKAEAEPAAKSARKDI
ncbi:MAG: YcjF family protein [Hyphomicrobiaceae bacterium]